MKYDKCEFCNIKGRDINGNYTNMYSQCCVCGEAYQFCITCLNTRTVTFCKICMREFLISEIEHK